MMPMRWHSASHSSMLCVVRINEHFSFTMMSEITCKEKMLKRGTNINRKCFKYGLFTSHMNLQQCQMNKEIILEVIINVVFML